MNRLFDWTWLPLLLFSCIGAGLASVFWWWRRRVADAEYHRHRLMAEAESDRLRLRVSSLRAAETRAEDLQIELQKTQADAARLPALVSEVKALRARAETIPDLERELDTIREGAVEAKVMESQLAALRTEASRTIDLESEILSLRARLDRAAELESRLAAAEGKAARVAELESQLAAAERRAGTVEGRAAGADAKGSRSSPAADAASHRNVDPIDGAPPPAEPSTLDSAAPEHRDDLQAVSGIGPVAEKTLNSLGIRTWEQLAALTPQDAIRVDEAIGSFPGRIERDQWIGQAADLVRRFPLRDPYDRPDRKALRGGS